MQNFRAFAVAVVTLVVSWSSPALAQRSVQGYGVERLYLSAPGAGWVVMDTLDMHGGLGVAGALTLGAAHDPLRVGTSGGGPPQHLAVVDVQAFADFGFAAAYERYRFYLNFHAPLSITGTSGTLGGYQFTAPSVGLGTNPDTLSDARIGFDARIVGDSRSAFRLGAGAQLFVPNGNRADYVTDGTYRAMVRVLAAGDIGSLVCAAHLGVHVRPLDDAPVPGSPKGSELLFGLAGGVRLPVRLAGDAAVIVGPEIYGATAFSSFLGTEGTALEGLLSGRIEGTRPDGVHPRLKVGAGAGLDPRFGAPDWRAVIAVEVFAHGNPD